MSIKEIMKKPITIGNDSTIHDALRKILQHNISRVLVTDDTGAPTWIVTEKDLGFFLLADKSEKGLDQIPLSTIKKPIISVGHVASIKDSASILLSKNIGSLGISNSEGVISGIITKTDLTRYYIDHFVGKKRVGDVMTVSYVSTHSEDSLDKVISEMLKQKVSRIILKDASDIPEGIMTFRDIFRISLTLGGEEKIVDNVDPTISVVFPRKGFVSDSGFGGTILAKELMQKNIVSVDYDDDLVTGCAEIIESNVHGVGVLINGKLSGILSKTDVMKAITQIG